jgi:hypothetical protein
MKKFYCRIFVPSTENYEYFKEINFFDSKNISKFIQNNDLKGLSAFLQDLVNKNAYDKNIKYNILDYLLILCQLRGYSYGNTVTFSIKNDNGSPFSFKHNVQRLLIHEEMIRHNFSKTVYDNKIQLYLDLPSNLEFLNETDIISKNIQDIVIDSQKINFFKLSKNHQESLLNELPASVSNKVLEYVKETTEFLSEFKFFENVAIKSFDNISLNPYNNSFIEYLKIIFSYDLMGLYELEYILIRKLKFSLTDLKNLSLNEAELHLNLYKKELKTMEEANNKSGVAKRATADN